MRHLIQSRVSAAAFMILLCGGCGTRSEKFIYVAVNGTVTCNGEPVKSGTVTFFPQAPNNDGVTEGNQQGSGGRPAIAKIQEDGTFVLSTSTSDAIENGAVVGTHQIIIEPGMKDGFDEDAEDADELEDEWSGKKRGNPYLEKLSCPPPRNLQIELAEGDSVLKIEMSGGGKVTKVAPEPD